MGREPSTFQKAQGLEPTDAYHDATFQVFFDDAGRVEYIELSDSDQFEARLGGLKVLRMPADIVVANLQEIAPFDRDDPELGLSYTFPKLELALWRPFISDKDGPEGYGLTFATVGVGRVGYFSAAPSPVPRAEGPRD